MDDIKLYPYTKTLQTILNLINPQNIHSDALKTLEYIMTDETFLSNLKQERSEIFELYQKELLEKEYKDKVTLLQQKIKNLQDELKTDKSYSIISENEQHTIPSKNIGKLLEQTQFELDNLQTKYNNYKNKNSLLYKLIEDPFLQLPPPFTFNNTFTPPPTSQNNFYDFKKLPSLNHFIPKNSGLQFKNNNTLSKNKNNNY